MVYLKHISAQQDVYIPKSRKADGGLVLSLKNTVNQSVVNLSVIDKWSMGHYFKFAIKLPADIPSGEHEYTLKDNAGVLSTGLLVVGESASPTEYKKVIQYEQCQ